MSKSALLILAALTLAACSDGGTEPGPSHVLPIGTYDYAAQILRGNQDWRFEGTLTISSADEELVTGTWDVAGVSHTDGVFETQIVHGFYNATAYVIAGEFDDGITTGIITNRIALVDGEVRCVRGVFLLVFGTTGSDNGPLDSCTVTGPR